MILLSHFISREILRISRLKTPDYAGVRPSLPGRLEIWPLAGQASLNQIWRTTFFPEISFVTFEIPFVTSEIPFVISGITFGTSEIMLSLMSRLDSCHVCINKTMKFLPDICAKNHQF